MSRLYPERPLEPPNNPLREQIAELARDALCRRWTEDTPQWIMDMCEMEEITLSDAIQYALDTEFVDEFLLELENEIMTDILEGKS